MIKKAKKEIRKLLNILFIPINNMFFILFVLFNKRCIKNNNTVCNELKGERILILAPHIDDDIIGCGGAILKYIASGKKIFIVYLTNSEKRGTKESNEGIAEERRQEAIEVAGQIGLPIKNLFFLTAKDGDLINSSIEAELYKIIKLIKPDKIFLPIFLDTHIDHYSVSIKLLNIFRKNKEIFNGMQIFLYESQSPITPLYSNIILNISDVYLKKFELLKVFKSQKNNFEFVRNTNRYNALLIRTKACEIFINISIEKYMEILSVFLKKDGGQAYYEIKKKLKLNRDNITLINGYISSLKYKKYLKQEV